MKTIFFDFGNVVGWFDHRRAIQRFLRRSSRTEAEIIAAVYGGSLEDAFETGRLSVNEFVLRATTAIGYRGTADEFIRDYVDVFMPNDEVCALIPRLRRLGITLVLASNTNRLHFDFFQPMFADTFRHFAALGVSFEAGARKPDAAFYQHCQRLAGGTPEEALFVDDIRQNVNGARAFGWDAVHYTSYPLLAAELRARGLDV